jgi:enamine deaminase RidA (YjgF/YER057c/UK114 family)
MLSTALTRRNFAARFAPVLSVLGFASLVSKPSVAKKNAHADEGVRKLNGEGQPADGTQMITPIVIHNGVAYIAGIGAHDSEPADTWDIGKHTTKVLDNVKKLVETAGSNMDNVVQLTVFLAKIDDYDGMNKVFKTYFPHGGPARTTVAIAALPGNSLVEINCVAALVKK